MNTFWVTDAQEVKIVVDKDMTNFALLPDVYVCRCSGW